MRGGVKTVKPWAAVIGSPINHSLSPVLHTTAYQLLDLDWEYRSFHVEPADLASFVANLEGQCVGLSVTAPLKRELVSLADAVDGLAKLVVSANTLVRAAGMNAAFNTDVQGIVDAVLPFVKEALQARPLRLDPAEEEGLRGILAGSPPPVIVGTGATACSALAAVRSLGASRAIVVGRSFAGKHNAFAVGTRMGMIIDPLLWKVADRSLLDLNRAPLVISTVPPAVTADLAALLRPSAFSTLLDVTYAHGATPLEEAFSARGAGVASPLAMLTHQGIAQVKLWTNRDVPFEPVYRAVCEGAATR